LAKDNNAGIRNLVANNSNTSPEVLSMLAIDDDKYVRHYVAKNSNTPSEVLMMLANNGDKYTKGVIALNLNATPEILSMLAADEEQWVRQGVTINPNTPINILHILANDKNVIVSETAKKMLQKKQSSRKIRLQKLSEQLENKYYPIGQKGDNYGGNADQESEVAEELNDSMESEEAEGNYTSNNDNLIIDKNNNPTDGFGVLALLEQQAILVKGRSKWKDLIAALGKLKNG
jgi:hypothetical protein